DVWMRYEAGDGVHQHSFSECRSRPRTTKLVQRGLMSHEWQRYELRKSTRALLQITYSQQVPCPRTIVVDMPEHNGRCGAQTDALSCLDHLEPLTCVEFVRAQHLPDSVIQDLGRCAWQAA